MAKIVIAGISDCPYFARVELLGDSMMKSLPAFHLEKIVKTPGEWTSWLRKTCQEHGWTHETSPLVWRDLLDSGGKRSLIGGASAFQEYAKAYYGFEMSLPTDDLLVIKEENYSWKKEMETEEAFYRELSKPLFVCITAAESPVCYSLVASLLGGEVFDKGTEVHLRLLVFDPKEIWTVHATAMEALDLCSMQLRGVEVVESPVDAFKNCSLIILLDELATKPEEDSGDWLLRHFQHFSAYGHHINRMALKHVRVLLAGPGPVNFNTLVLINSMPNIPRQNVVGLSMVVEGMARAVIAQRLKVRTSQVKDIIVWGNVNGLRVIDTSQAKVFAPGGAITGPEEYWETLDERLCDAKWLEEEFLSLLDQRSQETNRLLGYRPSNVTAMAVITTLKHLVAGSPKHRIFSLAVYSEGWYNVPPGLVFSFPVMMSPRGAWTVVQDIKLPRQQNLTLLDSAKELTTEAMRAYPAFSKYLDFIDRESNKLMKLLNFDSDDYSTSTHIEERKISKENVKFDLSVAEEDKQALAAPLEVEPAVAAPSQAADDPQPLEFSEPVL